MSKGWISLYRSIQESKLWYGEPFSRGQAWMDLLLLANHKKGYLRIDGKLFTIEKGQIGMSISSLSKLWMWSRWKVTNFLHELVADKRILLNTNSRTSIITICNYCDYQNEDLGDRQRTDSGPTADQQRANTNNKNNKNNKNNNREGYTEDFKNLALSEKYMNIAFDCGLSEEQAKKSWDKWKIYRGGNVPTNIENNWRAWALNERPVQKKDNTDPVQLLTSEEKLIAHLGMLNWKRSMYSRGANLALSSRDHVILKNYENVKGKVWWNNLDEYKKGKPKDNFDVVVDTFV